MSKAYILAIDEGTTGVTTSIVDESLDVVASTSLDFPQHFPKPGWVEHDLKEMLWALKQCLKDLDQKFSLHQVTSIGITNQRETICLWNRKTGEILHRALVWQDRRTASFCESLKKKQKEKWIQKKTGLLFDPYFSGTKINWALKNVPSVKAASKKGELAWGTIDCYLLYVISGGESYATEPSNASRTLLYDLDKGEFSKELFSVLGVPFKNYPEIKSSFGSFGKTKNFSPLPDGIPITGILGDQQSALLGQACVEPGMAKCTYGTGAFLLLQTGSKKILSKHKLLTTVAWQEKNGKRIFALEGSAFVAGSAVQWFRDGLGLIRSSEEIESLAKECSDTEGVVFVPSLTGLGAPYWNPHAQGMFYGITRGTKKSHFARAVLEGIAFQNYDLLEAMKKDFGKKLKALHVDGGASMNDLLMQFQADLLEVELRRPTNIESTSLGAVFASGLGAGVWSDFSGVKKAWKLGKTYTPKMEKKRRKEKLEQWVSAVKKVQIF